MFAFALYDAHIEKHDTGRAFLFLARDRMGIKPLYYSLDEPRQTLIFASEARALTESKAVPGELEPSALAAFLCFGSVPYPQTYRSRIRCLPPASVLTVSRCSFHVRSFWDLASAQASDGSLVDVLAEAVQSHLLADVPVGVFLSGGVDSAAVAALAARHTGRLSTLTIGFAEAEYSEAKEAREFALQIGADHHEIEVTADDFKNEISNFLMALDQPTTDGVNTYFVSRAARQLGLKVVLSGLGGDEVFFGYNHYRNLIRRSGALGRYAYAPSLLRVMAGTAASALSDLAGREQWGRFDYCRGRSLNESLYLLVRGFFPPVHVADLLGISLREVNEAVDTVLEPLRPVGENGTVNAGRIQELELRRYMHDQLLRDSDLFSMSHSIELRVPLIDHKVVEAARATPFDRRVENGLNKPLLVNAVPGGILSDVARRPKRGFVFPFDSWLRKNADEFQAFAMEGSLLNRKAVAACWDRFRNRRLHWSRAWSTVVLRTFRA
jgi:asparagine synthase (glutamine-hydrolysing)